MEVNREYQHHVGECLARISDDIPRYLGAYWRWQFVQVVLLALILWRQW